MSAKEPITIPVDLTNPGQFFACCGLLELADRLWPGAEGPQQVVAGWFDRRHFCIATGEVPRKLAGLLREARALRFDVGDDRDDDVEGESEDDGTDGVEPIRLAWNDNTFATHLDWWADRSIKPWAGSMKERVILRAMLDAIDPDSHDPFNDLKRVQYQSPKLTKAGKRKKSQKKEPFYFDPRRGNRSHPLDCGFSPDTHKMEAECCPALEALCFIGLQRARPAATGVANRSRYTVWPRLAGEQPGLPANLVGAVVPGMIRVPNSIDYIFDNYFRTDQRKHKTFSQATIERSLNVGA